MLHRLVDELVLDVFREVLDELDVATVKQLANALLNSLDILRLSLQLLALLVDNTCGSILVRGEKLLLFTPQGQRCPDLLVGVV